MIPHSKPPQQKKRRKNVKKKASPPNGPSQAEVGVSPGTKAMLAT